MSIHGKRDPEAERKRIEKAQAAGFGQPGKAGRPRKDATEVIEERAADRMEYLADKALDAIERGMKSPNEKTALDAANKFLNNFHHPTKKVDVSGQVDHNEYHLHLLKGQNQLSQAEQDLLGEFLDVLKDGAEAEKEIVEAEVVEDDDNDTKELPETTPKE